MPQETIIMSTSAMSRAMRRGIRRGMMMQSEDMSSIRKMRKEIQNRDLTAESWDEVGQAIYEAMGQMPPRTTGNSLSSRTPNTKK